MFHKGIAEIIAIPAETKKPPPVSIGINDEIKTPTIKPKEINEEYNAIILPRC